MELTDQWVVGFVDGDGCFRVYKQKSDNNRYIFVVSQDKRSIHVLYALKTKFGCGSVHSAGGGGQMYEYKVTNQNHLINYIIPFFFKNPLQTVKNNDFIKLAEALTNTQFTERKVTPLTRDWLVGFIDAEGCFYVSMVENYPRPQLKIGLHIRDKDIIERIQAFIEFGVIYHSKTKPVIHYQISSKDGMKSIIKICTTGANRCLLKTTKRIDFLKFKQIVRIISEKKHLTPKGILTINKILKK